jgi:protein-tyrosine phosphatase
VSWESARHPVRVYAGPAPGRIDRATPAAVARTGTEVTIPSPVAGAPQYFEVVARDRRRGPVVGDRFIGLAGAPAARDLGGYQTIDGRHTRWGRAFRTDGLGGLTDADRARLAALGLPTECPDAPTATPDAASLRAAATAVTSAAARTRDEAFLRRAARDPVPQWVHCDTFTDRFGWPAALLLATLGVRRETVVADHLAGARSGIAPLPDRGAIDVAFDTIRRRYKTFDRYLVRGLGLDAPTYGRLRDRYVTER